MEITKGDDMEITKGDDMEITKANLRNIQINAFKAINTSTLRQTGNLYLAFATAIVLTNDDAFAAALASHPEQVASYIGARTRTKKPNNHETKEVKT